MKREELYRRAMCDVTTARKAALDSTIMEAGLEGRAYQPPKPPGLVCLLHLSPPHAIIRTTFSGMQFSGMLLRWHALVACSLLWLHAGRMMSSILTAIAPACPPICLRHACKA